MPVPSCFYCSSEIEFDVREGDASGSFFIVQDSFGYTGSLVFPYEIDYCSFKMENCVGILMGIALNP